MGVAFIILGKMLKYINLNHRCIAVFAYASNYLDCHILSCLTVPTFQNSTKCAYSTSKMLNDASRMTKNTKSCRHQGTWQLTFTHLAEYLISRSEILAEIEDVMAFTIVVPSRRRRLSSSTYHFITTHHLSPFRLWLSWCDVPRGASSFLGSILHHLCNFQAHHSQTPNQWFSPFAAAICICRFFLCVISATKQSFTKSDETCIDL